MSVKRHGREQFSRGGRTVTTPSSRASSINHEAIPSSRRPATPTLRVCYEHGLRLRPFLRRTLKQEILNVPVPSVVYSELQGSWLNFGTRNLEEIISARHKSREFFKTIFYSKYS